MQLHAHSLCEHVSISMQIFTDPKQFEVEALADAKFQYLCVPVKLAAELGLKVLGERVYRDQHGKTQSADYVGPIKVEVLGKTSFTGAVVAGEQVILGELTLLELGLALEPVLIDQTPPCRLVPLKSHQ